MSAVPISLLPRVLTALFGLSLSASAVPVAFPGAEGFGRFATGGRGGEVYIVTNLNDSGPGSFRTGVATRTAGVPRTIVFAVSGTLYLQSTLRITQGDLTIAGQTAPGDGICLAYYPIDPSNSTNVIIRFLRSRLGDVSGKENDAFSCRYATNLIIDHCSFSWSVDETSSTYDNTDLTLQWCFITESLRDSVHSKGAHGYGGIWGGLGATYHHNLIAHHDSRNPRFNGARTHGTAGELVDMRNNVIYNWSGNSTYGGEPTDAGLSARHNMVNNTYKRGPATGTAAKSYRILEPSANTTAPAGSTYSLFHITGNWTTGSTAVTTNNWAGGVQVIASSLYSSIRSDTAFAVPAVVTQTAQASFPLVLAYAGCRAPTRDAVDTRIVGEVTNGTATYRGSVNNYAGIIDSQTDVGGWPALASLPAPTDTDADGMPDAWETAHGLNPSLASDRNLTDADGYTQLELYLNSLATVAFPVPQITTQPTAVTVAHGAAFTLSSAATGTGALTYQWYKDGALLPGAMAASYSVTAAAAANAGNYHVVVTNAYGSTPSASAAVGVTLPPDAYADFLALHGLNPAGNGADDADPDADGLPNALEFILGGIPVDPASAPQPTLALEAPTQGAFSFARLLASETLFDLVVEQSADLASWSALAEGVGGVTVTLTPLDASYQLVTLRAPLTAPRTFFRLRTTRN